MTSREFCYWLQGFFEIQDAGLPPNVKVDGGLVSEKVQCIKRHLAMVFKHEIDPSYPNQAALNQIHDPGLEAIQKAVAELQERAVMDAPIRC